MAMRKWQTLRASRLRRELRAAAASAAHFRADRNRIANERDAALRAPITRLKARALAYIGDRVGVAALEVLDQFTRNAIEQMCSQGVREMSISLMDRFEDRTTVVRVVIPRQVSQFMVDVDNLMDRS